MHLISIIDLLCTYFIYEILHLCCCHKNESDCQDNADVDKSCETDEHVKMAPEIMGLSRPCSLDGPTSVVFTSPENELLPH